MHRWMYSLPGWRYKIIWIVTLYLSSDSLFPCVFVCFICLKYRKKNMGAWITISEKKFPNGFQCLRAMALLDAQVQSTPQHHFDSSCKILFPLGKTMAMCPLISPLITHNYLTASGHVTEEKLHCFMFPRENTAICSSILKHGQPPWLLGWDTASLLLEGPTMQAVWLTCLAYLAVLECLSSGSTALERAVDVSIECQMEERGK